jgi:hypothetical protein
MIRPLALETVISKAFNVGAVKAQGSRANPGRISPRGRLRLLCAGLAPSLVAEMGAKEREHVCLNCS